MNATQRDREQLAYTYGKRNATQDEIEFLNYMLKTKTNNCTIEIYAPYIRQEIKWRIEVLEHNLTLLDMAIASYKKMEVQDE